MPEDNTYTTASTTSTSTPDDMMPPVVNSSSPSDSSSPSNLSSLSDSSSSPDPAGSSSLSDSSIPPFSPIDTSSQDASTQDTLIQDVSPVQDMPVQDISPLDTPTQNTPTQNVPSQTMPTQSQSDVASSSPMFNDPGDLFASSEHGPIPEIYSDVASKISESHNVLIALSSDPSVDEMAAAIGLSLYLDRLGKRATAIYSGTTPNALEFLKPEETFEPTADALQDFVIALNKEKADHLRYKLDGEYVKIYITPYSSRISQDDLEFSYGDFNVDLVLALDVANGIDLDSALREHGRIMHDAIIINITTGNPGKFGEIEWSDKRASSVSEMIAKLLYSVKSDIEIGKEEATAFLTGIVAATNRFSNAQTTPETMQISSRLMRSGANQQLISKNITPDVDNELYSLISGGSLSDSAEPRDTDPTKLDIQHGNEKNVDENKEISGEVTEKESTLLEDLKAAEASLAQTGTETTPDLSNQPVKIDSDESMSPEDFTAKQDELLADSDKGTNPAATNAPVAASAPEINGVPDINYAPLPDDEVLPPPPTPSISSPLPNFGPIESSESKLATSSDKPILSPLTSNESSPSNTEPSPAVEPFLPPVEPSFAAEPVLPPVETTTVPEPDFSNAESNVPIEPSRPVTEPTPTSLGSQPAMQDQVYHPQAADPSAFRIPGM